MVYVFVWVGEFGVELLNWHAVIHRFAATIPSGDSIVCCSRAGVYPLYDFADEYLDIGDLPRFQQSQASGYYACLVMKSRSNATNPPLHPQRSLRAAAHSRYLIRELESVILERLRHRGLVDRGSECRFVFSSRGTRLNGCIFGQASYRDSLPWLLVRRLFRGVESASPSLANTLRRVLRASQRRLGRPDYRGIGQIYDRLDVGNNHFQKIHPDLGAIAEVEGKLGWRLREPYVLCQHRRRPIRQPSAEEMARDREAALLRLLARATGMRIVLLSFATGRRNDSHSDFPALPECARYECGEFPEQACLIHFSAHCLFFTEGDLGSHTYVPPLMGKDVTVIAPRSVFSLVSSPIDFWNRSVFRFGGQLLPRASDDVFRSEDSMRELAEEVRRRAQQSEKHPGPVPARSLESPIATAAGALKRRSERDL